MSRAKLAKDFAALAGAGFELVDAATGWPSLGVARIEGAVLDLALFIGPIGGSHRRRDRAERRFQNPGQDRPILLPPRRVPVLAGLWLRDDEIEVSEPVLAVVDVHRRVGRGTRFSVFVPLESLVTASGHGWAEARSDAHERITCFRAAAFGEFAQLRLVEPPEHGMPETLRRGLGVLGCSPEEVLADLRETRSSTHTADRLSVPVGMVDAVFENAGRPFLLADVTTGVGAGELVDALRYLQLAADALGVDALSRSGYDAFARSQQLTVESWPRHGTLARLFGGWDDACEAAGLSAEFSEPSDSYPAQRCREHVDAYVTACVSTQTSPSSAGYQKWRSGNGGAPTRIVEERLGPLDDVLRSSLARIDA